MNEFAPKPAATVLLVRDAAALEVLMVARSAAMEFGAEAWVFPGGKVCDADHDPAWGGLSDGSYSGLAQALRVAAAREVFEETGLLLARRPGDAHLADADAAAPLADRRFDVEQTPALFAELIAGAQLRLALDRLTPFAHWITPPIETRRFDTHFFVVRAPSKQIALHDGREAVDHDWVAPKHALEARKAGRVKLMFPTRLNLEKLGESERAEEAVAAAQARPVVTVEPTLFERDGQKRLRIPAEAGYSVVEVALDNVMK